MSDTTTNPSHNSSSPHSEQVIRPILRLGTHGKNHTLFKRHIFADRTCRQATAEAKGLAYCQELATANLRDLRQIVIWTREHGIHLYRLTSGAFPHITNPYFIPASDRSNYQVLAYSLEPFREVLSQIGEYARTHGMRLTFHPGQYTTISPENPEILIRAKRDLHFHCTVLDMMGLDDNSICVIHGGGTYKNKPAATARWIQNYLKLPSYIRHRIALENDEDSYSIADVLEISRAVADHYRRAGKPEPRLPIILDIFHYQCYNRALRARSESPLPPVKEFLPEVIASWESRTVKMHYSEQRPDASTGSHSDYVKEIPAILRNFPKRYDRSLDLMIEAKANELATLRIGRKYGYLT